MIGARRHLRTLIAAVFAILLLSFRPAFAADNACNGLSTATPHELLAIFGAEQLSDEWVPPGVGCTWDGPDPKPAECEWTTTITQDRMLGNDRRLIVASSSRPNSVPSEQIFVFGCAAGQIKVRYNRFQPGAKVVRAASDSVVVAGFRQPFLGSAQLENWPSNPYPDRGLSVFNLNDDFQQFSHQSSIGVPPSCSELRTADANRLLAMADREWQGPGCASDDPDEPDRCDVKSKIGEDRMMGEERRLVTAFFESHSGPWWKDDISVFGCVSGQLRVIYQNTFNRDLKQIEEASADKLVLVLYVPGSCMATPAGEKLTTLSWNARLESYVLSSVHFRPLSRRKRSRAATPNTAGPEINIGPRITDDSLPANGVSAGVGVSAAAAASGMSVSLPPPGH